MTLKTIFLIIGIAIPIIVLIGEIIYHRVMFPHLDIDILPLLFKEIIIILLCIMILGGISKWNPSYNYRMLNATKAKLNETNQIIEQTDDNDTKEYLKKYKVPKYEEQIKIYKDRLEIK